MIYLPLEQGSPEWLAARVGLPTASQFHRILTPVKGELSKAADSYRNELVAEWMLGAPLDADVSQFMERGTMLEPEAVRYYEMQRDTDTEPGGLVLLDDGSAGCSPDRLVGLDGGCEIKCPSPAVHVGYLLGDRPVEYRCQVQGNLWITGRAWWDFLSYHPKMPPVLVRYERDEVFIGKLAAAMVLFTAGLRAARERLTAGGFVPPLVPIRDTLLAARGTA